MKIERTPGPALRRRLLGRASALALATGLSAGLLGAPKVAPAGDHRSRHRC